MNGSEHITSQEIKERLKARYSKPEWCFVAEVADGTGSKKERTIDGLAFGMWGINEIHAFEIKVSRSDWLRELDAPAKASSFAAHSHRFFIVAPPGIVGTDELPSDWGLIETAGKGLKVRRGAALRLPEPLGFSFLAAIIRKVSNTEHRELMSTNAYAEGFKNGQAINTKELERHKQDYLKLLEVVQTFEQSAGICIQGPGSTQKGVNFGDYIRLRDSGIEIDRMIERLRNAIDNEQKRLNSLRLLLPENADN